MSDGASREMTLREWCEKLPDSHRANRELRALEAVAGWAAASVEMYGYVSDVQDPMHQLAVALREIEETT